MVVAAVVVVMAAVAAVVVAAVVAAGFPKMEEGDAAAPVPNTEPDAGVVVVELEAGAPNTEDEAAVVVAVADPKAGGGLDVAATPPKENPEEPVVEEDAPKMPLLLAVVDAVVAAVVVVAMAVKVAADVVVVDVVADGAGDEAFPNVPVDDEADVAPKIDVPAEDFAGDANEKLFLVSDAVAAVVVLAGVVVDPNSDAVDADDEPKMDDEDGAANENGADDVAAAVVVFTLGEQMLSVVGKVGDAVVVVTVDDGVVGAVVAEAAAAKA